MSTFNKPYRNNKEMVADESERQRREKQKSRKLKNTLADQIFKAVLDAIRGGETKFSKKEMVKLVAGDRKISQVEWFVWNKACVVAINRIRVRFWPLGKNSEATDRKMFNFIRDTGKYWLIPINEEAETRLGASIVYESYVRKIKGMARKQGQIATSAYNKIIELDQAKRTKLINDLREQHMLENGEVK